MSKQQIEILKPFGPTVAKVIIPEKIIVELNNYVDEIINNEKKSAELDHGKKLVGNVKQEFKLEMDFMKKIGWIDFLSSSVANWVYQSKGKKITKFGLIACWVVRQFQNEYNPVHWHNGHVSGAGYLKVPKTFGGHFQKGKEHKNKNGNLELIHGSRMFLSNSAVSFIPEVGNFYLFPHYLMHSVYPFYDSNEERRSISFNANIDPNIYDVYEK
jgi:hypothetical protein